MPDIGLRRCMGRYGALAGKRALPCPESDYAQAGVHLKFKKMHYKLAIHEKRPIIIIPSIRTATERETKMSETTVTEMETDAPESESKKANVSTKVWLDGDDKVVSRLEDAVSLQYKTNATGRVHSYIVAGAVGRCGTMCELFGIKTKLTNVASTARNSRDKDGNPNMDEDEAIVDFLDGLQETLDEDGNITSPAVWRERKAGVAAETKYDKAIIAQAMIQVAKDTDRTPKSEADYIETLSKRGMVVKVMNMPTIRKAYDDIAGTDDSEAIDSVL